MRIFTHLNANSAQCFCCNSKNLTRTVLKKPSFRLLLIDKQLILFGNFTKNLKEFVILSILKEYTLHTFALRRVIEFFVKFFEK